MIKCNPSVVVLVFAGTGPLLIQTYRRPELTVFMLTQREGMVPKTKITWANSVNLHFSGRKETINFDQKVKAIMPQAKGSYNQGLTRNLQLNNFVNALRCGYL
jgi:hypothetical protein